MLSVTGDSIIDATESPQCEQLPETVFSLSSVLFSLKYNHHDSTYLITNTLQLSYHIHSESLLATLASRQPPGGACTAAVVPRPDLYHRYPYLLLTEAAYLTNSARSQIPQRAGFLFPQKRRLPTFPSNN